jgi:exodeoxyribonuclease VII large subunit
MTREPPREYTVSELSFALKRTVESAYGLVRVRGEISGFKRAASGHGYFSLKDDRAVLDAVWWKGSQRRLAVAPEDGLEVVCTGMLTTYPGRSKYQLVVEQIEPAGIGALMALLEERKRRLAAEGLFAAERKRPLPFLPEVIGVVTSPTGAVIRDILHRIADRFPRRVLVWPVLVQGDGAAEQIAAAIAQAGRLPERGEPPRPDLLIVARGGGSIEDLWAFNEESVVRAVAACPIPVIAAVGHETDTTLIDLVADRRAPTPSAAAEMAVPVRRELAQQLDGLAERAAAILAQRLDGLRHRVAGLARGLPEPVLLVTGAAQRLDDMSERLARAARLQLERRVAALERAGVALRAPGQRLDEAARRLALAEQRLALRVADRLATAAREGERLGVRLAAIAWEARLAVAGARSAEVAQRLVAAARRAVEERRRRLEALGQLADSLAPERVLERGYAIVRAAGMGPILPSRVAALAHHELDLQFADGTLSVRREERRPRGRAVGPAAQERLL